MSKILNLTQHPATQEQVADGVYEPSSKVEVQNLLTFNDLPSVEEMRERALKLANLALTEGAESAMIGGAPYFMSALESTLAYVGVTPLYAFSVRQSVEKIVDGQVMKTAIFVHRGFVRVA